MPSEITMPQQSDTMTEGTVVKWRKQEGDKVKSGETIAEIETDKAVMEMEAFEGGTLAHIAVKEGEKFDSRPKTQPTPAQQETDKQTWSAVVKAEISTFRDRSTTRRVFCSSPPRRASSATTPFCRRAGLTGSAAGARWAGTVFGADAEGCGEKSVARAKTSPHPDTRNNTPPMTRHRLAVTSWSTAPWLRVGCR